MKRLSLFFLILLAGPLLYAQKYTISGTIQGAETGEALISANIFETGLKLGTVSNTYGFFSMKLPAGKRKVHISYIGFQTYVLDIDLKQDTLISLKLLPDNQLSEVVVKGNSVEQKVRSTQMSTIQLPVKNIKQIPVILGEPDIIKTLQLMPGVQGGTEGSSGFYVRGGGPDQNLILLDGVPVYNVNHLFGFVSVFNANAINNVTLTKGGFPARYGGRLSSVLDIRMKEGNMKEFKGSASVGIISADLTLEGPIIKDKSSFIISGRRSYIDALTTPFLKIASKLNDDDFIVGYYLYDLNAKVNYVFSPKSRLYLSAYIGRDKFYFKDRYDYDYFGGSEKTEDEFGLYWGNITSALRWNYIFDKNLFSNSTLTFTDYGFNVFEDYFRESYENGEKENYSFYYRYFSSIRDVAIKEDFDWIINTNNYVRFGVNNTVHVFSPGVNVLKEDSEYYGQPVDTTFGNQNIPANEFSAYIEDDFKLGSRFNFNVGLHYSNFFVNNTWYHSLQPRIAGRFLIADNFTLKASYVEMSQYLHLLSNSTIGLPTDLWVPVTDKIKPQKSRQAAFGAALSINNDVEVTLEGFYKELENPIEYTEGASFFDLQATDWQTLVTSGEGSSYGLEFFVQKQTGKTTGWIGYTLSWANRRFDHLNNGKEFPYKYDSRHDFSIAVTHKFNEKWDAGLVWVYRTGYAFTFLDEKFASLHGLERDRLIPETDSYWDEGTDMILHSEERNAYRMPNYHRLDLGFNYHKKKKKTERVWSFGFYNSYNRMNPFMIYEGAEYNEATGEYESQMKQISILPIIPYVRWSIKF